LGLSIKLFLPSLVGHAKISSTQLVYSSGLKLLEIHNVRFVELKCSFQLFSQNNDSIRKRPPIPTVATKEQYFLLGFITTCTVLLEFEINKILEFHIPFEAEHELDRRNLSRYSINTSFP
jgi:hypothetical protein